MDIREIRLNDLFNRQEITYVIPIFQRKYSWTPQNVKTLLEDIDEIQRPLGKYNDDDFTDYLFLNSIMLQKKQPSGIYEGFASFGSAAGKEFFVIDGQQRITTFFFILKEMHELADKIWKEIRKDITIDEEKKNRIKDEIEGLRDMIKEFVVISQKNGVIKPKIIFKDDRNKNIFHKLIVEYFQQDSVPFFQEEEKKSNMYKSMEAIKKFFREKMKNKIPEQQYRWLSEFYFKMFEQISIISMELEPKDRAQKIFQSINGRGLSLSNMDFIKNYLFMNLDKEDMESLFEKYKKVESVLFSDEYVSELTEKERDKEFERFLKVYLTIKLKRKIPKERLYEAFYVYYDRVKNEEIKKQGGNPFYNAGMRILSDIEKYACFYREIFLKESDFINIYQSLKEFGIEAANPFILYLRTEKTDSENKKSIEALNKICEAVESLFVRIKFAGGRPENTIQFFIQLIHEIEQKKENIESLVPFIRKKIKNSPNYIDDIRLKERMKVIEYKEKGFQKALKYILFKIEKKVYENTNIRFTDLKNSKVEIEHVLPQQKDDKDYTESYKELPECWKESFKTEEEYKHCLNKMGNLVLLYKSENIRVSNKCFEEKKKQYNKSPFLSTREICSFEEWNKESIDTRTEKLAEQISCAFKF